eukprot:6192783-Pleurochrysis_carterae.AAC.4
MAFGAEQRRASVSATQSRQLRVQRPSAPSSKARLERARTCLQCARHVCAPASARARAFARSPA